MKPGKCPNCENTDMHVGWAKTQAGREIYPHYCPDCMTVTTWQANKAEAAAYEAAFGYIERVYTATENVEVHHWAQGTGWQSQTAWS